MPANVGQQIAANWQAKVGTKPEDNIHNEYAMLANLVDGKAFMPVTGGRSLIGQIEYTLNTTVKAISDTETLDTTRVDVFDEWESSWKQYAGTVLMSSLEAAMNRGENSKFKLLPAKLQSLEDSMRKQLNDDIFGDGSGYAGKALTGLQVLVADSATTGTVQGISRVSYSFWRNQQTSGAQTSAAYDNLRAAMRTMYRRCSAGQNQSHPTWAMTGETTHAGYESLLIANERVTGKEKKDYNAGFRLQWSMFADIPVMYDKACSNSRMYFGNDRNLKLAYQSDFWFKGYPAVDPANQLVDVFKVETQAQLITDNPRRLGVITSIT